MLSGPIPATRKVLDRAGLDLDDIELAEVNEAFASVPLAWARELGADMGRMNVNGGAIALGHPLGGTGARLMTSLVHEMRRRGAATGFRPCARAAAWPTRRSSSWSDREPARSSPRPRGGRDDPRRGHCGDALGPLELAERLAQRLPDRLVEVRRAVA